MSTIWVLDKSGLALSILATTPETYGAATDVPDFLLYVWLCKHDIMPVPGAEKYSVLFPALLEVLANIDVDNCVCMNTLDFIDFSGADMKTPMEFVVAKMCDRVTTQRSATNNQYSTPPPLPPPSISPLASCRHLLRAVPRLASTTPLASSPPCAGCGRPRSRHLSATHLGCR